MRPRVFPAEDESGLKWLQPFASASMRPRVFPAEDKQRLAQGAAEAQQLQ